MALCVLALRKTMNDLQNQVLTPSSKAALRPRSLLVRSYSYLSFKMIGRSYSCLSLERSYSCLSCKMRSNKVRGVLSAGY